MPDERTPRTAGATPGAPPAPDVSIVMVTMSNWTYLGPCLESLAAMASPYAYEIIIVDNGSTDGTQDRLRAGYPHVRLIENGRNLGLSRATNQGIQAARGRHVLLLNDDTLVTGASLDALVTFLDGHPDAGAAGGRLLNEDGSLQAGFNRFPTIGEEILIATRVGAAIDGAYPSTGDAAAARRVDWIGSACLLIRRAAIEEVGLLDEEFFIYGDEVDLQFRLKRAGWHVYYLPDVSTIHFGGRSLNRWRRRRMVYRGKMLFYRKNYGFVRAGVLRIVLGGLTLAKLGCWAVTAVLPPRRDRARRELQSNVEVLRLCVRLK
ncbi:MAG: glycosyltransferase family 2 protein [Vicinamibacterales bacterium]